MSSLFLLDTNAYFLLFQNPKKDSYDNIINKIRCGESLSFYISKITSLEIHSVLGKYGRGAAYQEQVCERKTLRGDSSQCVWVSPKRIRMKPKVFRGIQKVISDIEAQRGDIKAYLLGLDTNTIEIGKQLLIEYADKYSFGSHDSLIAATAIEAKRSFGSEIIVVTSDKGLKSVLRETGISFFDPK